MTLQKDIFCAGEQKVTKHTCSVDSNNEVVCICDGCQRVLKFPVSDRATFDKLLSMHQAANVGQINEEIQKTIDIELEAKFKAMFGHGGVI